MPTYTTKSDFKAFFPVSGSGDDTLIESLLEEQEEKLQRDLGYTFGEDSGRTDEWKAAIKRIIYPPKVPISSITTLEINDSTIDSDYYDISDDGFSIWLDDEYDYCRNVVEVRMEYTAGYDTNSFPKALKRVIYLRAGMIYSAGHTTMKTRDKNESGAYTSPEEMRNFIRETVSNYRLYAFGEKGNL